VIIASPFADVNAELDAPAHQHLKPNLTKRWFDLAPLH